MNQTSLAMVETVARHLDGLREQVVFLGGAVTGLLLTDPVVSEVRATKDVDVIVEVTSHAKYYQLEEQLRALGFRNEAEVICRWSIADVLVDIMPTDTTILGFSNRWYSTAVKHSQRINLADDLMIFLVTPVHFLATKIAAFEGRGDNDYLASHDLEDIITLLDGRAEIVQEIATAPADIRQYLQEKMSNFLNNPNFLEALPGHLPSDEAGQQRYPLIIQRMQLISAGESR